MTARLTNAWQCYDHGAAAYWDRYHAQAVRRALALLAADMGICRRYLHHLELDGHTFEYGEDLIGVGKGDARRYFAA